MITFNALELGLAALVAVLIIAIIVILMRSRRHTADLKARFGPEYSRTVEDVGDERKAAALLHEREKRVARFEIKRLSPDERERFSTAWNHVQAQFVDDPAGAVSRADVLLADVMHARGYPVAEFDQRSADLSVDYPAVVQNYRSAHDIGSSHARGEAGTEDLRQALIHYRVLFDDLLGKPDQEDRSPRPNDVSRATTHL